MGSAHELGFGLRVGIWMLTVALAALPLRQLVWMKGSSAVEHVEWQPDGTWVLTDGRGHLHTTGLCPSSATFGPWLLLTWRRLQDGQSFSALIDSTESEPTALRALKGRLRHLPMGHGQRPAGNSC